MYSIQTSGLEIQISTCCQKTASKQLFLFMILSLFGLRRPMAMLMFDRHLKHTYVQGATYNVRTLHDTTYEALSVQCMGIFPYNVRMKTNTMYV